MKRIAIVGAAAILLGGLCLLVPTPSPARAQGDDNKKLAGQAREILDKHCSKCHGVQRKGGPFDVRDVKTLLVKRDDGNYLTPKDLKASYIWTRVGADKDMPPSGPIPDDEQKVIKAWIEAGAPDWSGDAPKAVQRPFVSMYEMLNSIKNHLMDAEEEDRPYLRYFTFTHMHNNPAIDDDKLAIYRAALSKVLNSMHWQKNIVLPAQVDKYGTVFAIDLRDLDWDRKRILVESKYEYGKLIYGKYKLEEYDRWAVMMQYYAYGLVHDDPDNPKVNKVYRDIAKETRNNKIVMRADWFVARATRPPIYEQVLRLPKNARDLEQRLGVDVADNFRRNRLKRAGYSKSFISSQNRLVERHDSLYGAYWKSYDFKRGAENSNLLRFPLGPTDFGRAYPKGKYPYENVAFKHDGGEMIFHLPNNLQGYYLSDGKDNFITTGPPDVVNDTEMRSGTTEIINGLSCISCHKNGMIESVRDDVRNGTALDGEEVLRKIRQIYAPRPEFLKLVAKDREQFLRGVEEAVRPYLGKTKYEKTPVAQLPEPLTELVKEYYHLDLNLERVAYELGYKDAVELRGSIKGNPKLSFLRSLISKDEGGGVKRDEWDNGDKFDKPNELGLDSKFQKAAYSLGLGAAR